MMSQRDLPAAKVLRLAWQRHYAYEQGEVRFKGSKEITKEDPEVELRRLLLDLQAKKGGWLLL